MAVVTRRSTMALFSNGASHLSHCVRIVLAEKDITVEIIDTHPSEIPEEVSEYNPYNSLPTLVDRELALYCLLYTSPSPRDRTRSRMPSSA